MAAAHLTEGLNPAQLDAVGLRRGPERVGRIGRLSRRIEQREHAARPGPRGRERGVGVGQPLERLVALVGHQEEGDQIAFFIRILTRISELIGSPSAEIGPRR